MDGSANARGRSRGFKRNLSAHQFQNYKQNVVDDEGPFAPIAIGGDAKDDGPN